MHAAHLGMDACGQLPRHLVGVRLRLRLRVGVRVRVRVKGER